MIYLTADAVISSLGFTTDECWEQMLQYQSGVKSIDDVSLFPERFLAAQIPVEKLQKLVVENNLQSFSRLEQILILSIRQTILKSGLDVSDCGFILASTKGNISRLTANNETGDELFLSHLSEKIAGYFGFTSKSIVICNACISGVSALIAAKRMIENGNFKNVIVAGGDELSRFVVTGFHAFKSVSSEVCKPYDAARDGLSLGEACGSLLLTSDKSKVSETEPIVIQGGAVSNDANHISGPSRTGEELALAINSAVEQADIQSDEISFINAHGTATVYNDEMESKAIHLSELSNIPLQSLKPYFGHTLGAAGVIETIICKKQLETNTLLAVPNFETSGVPFPLNISAEHKQTELTSCLKTASGFGGCNAAIVLRKNFKGVLTKNTDNEINVKTNNHCKIGLSGIELNGEKQLSKDSSDDFATFIRKAYGDLGMEYRKFYKMDDLSKLGFIATEYLLRSIPHFAEIQPEKKGIIVANRSASLDTDINYRRNIDSVGDKEASPAIFVYTLPNVMLGEICIYWKMKGENTFFIQREFDKSFLMQYAEIVMNEQNLNYCIVGWCDLLGSNFEAEMYLVEKE